MYKKEEMKELRASFWEGFGAYCEVQPYLRGRKKLWMLYDTKVKGVELKFDVERHSACVVLEINHRNEQDRLEMFERIGWYKESLEAGFEENPLTWDICYIRDTGKQVCRIYTRIEDIDFHRQTDWGTFYQFMATNMYKLEKNFNTFVEYLRD